MLLAADGGWAIDSTVSILDLTAAFFDTVDHDLLLLRLMRRLEIHAVPLQWFRSYLQGRSFRIVDDDSHCLLSITRLGSWSESVHFVQGGPSRSRGEA